MKSRLLVAGGLMLALAGAAGAQECWTGAEADSFGPETINYKVNYHWGIIDTTAAHGIVKLESEGTQLKATLNGHSIDWGGRQYTVADTLDVTTLPGRDNLFARQRVDYRAGWYTKPEVSELKDGSFDADNPANFKNIAGQGTLDASNATMEAVTISTNMLGLFYLFRTMDFDEIPVGRLLTVSLTAPGHGLQHAYITYLGESNYNGTPAYKVVFEYTYQGARSNYPVTCEIDKNTRIPLMLSAKLEIGKMEMIKE